MRKVILKNAEWVVAWDEAGDSHIYIEGADLVFEGDAIVFVGHDYVSSDSDGATVVDARGKMIMPGLVDIHSHLAHEPINKGFTDETGSKGLYSSNLYEYMPVMEGDEEAAPWQTRLAAAELLASGVTTIVDLTVPYPGWVDALAETGLRACIAPMFRSARWFTRNGHLVEYEWHENAGFDRMEEALKIIEIAESHPSGRISGMVSPTQIDTCTPELIQASYHEAMDRGLPWQIHAAQSLPEFHEITRRHGLSPVQWLESLGVLGPRSIMAHGIFLDDHPKTHWHSTSDIGILAETDTTVAHCPTVFMRRGMALCHLGRYLDAGINVGIGTDTYPHNLIEEMRHAGYVARLMAGNPHAVTTAQVFNAATVSGAKALGRTDIGRLTPGAKADIVLIDMNHHMMRPSRDPIRSLVYAAADRAVDTVYVAGKQVVANGRALNVDFATAATEVDAAQRRAEQLVPERDLVAGRTSTEMSPLSFPRKYTTTRNERIYK